MKYVIIGIYILLLTVYGYSVHMTSVDPGNNLWGFICAFIFTLLSIFSVYLFTKYGNKREKNDETE